jgi:hypothetical protein
VTVLLHSDARYVLDAAATLRNKAPRSPHRATHDASNAEKRVTL